MDAVQRWIHEHPDEMQGIALRWEPAEQEDEDAYLRLLEILFAPRAGDAAA